MITAYLKCALSKARYDLLEDKSFYGEIPGFDGVYATSPTLEGCSDELEEVLEEWVMLRLSRNLELPAIDGLNLAIKEVCNA